MKVKALGDQILTICIDEKTTVIYYHEQRMLCSYDGLIIIFDEIKVNSSANCNYTGTSWRLKFDGVNIFRHISLYFLNYITTGGIEI